MLPILSLAYRAGTPDSDGSDRISLRQAVVFTPEYRILVVELDDNYDETGEKESLRAYLDAYYENLGLTMAESFHQFDYILFFRNAVVIDAEENLVSGYGLGAVLLSRTGANAMFSGEADFVSDVVKPLFAILAELKESGEDSIEPFFRLPAGGYAQELPKIIQDAQREQLDFLNTRISYLQKGELLATMMLLDEITNPGYEHIPQISASLQLFQHRLPSTVSGGYLDSISPGLILIATIVGEQSEHGAAQVVLQPTEYTLERRTWQSGLAREWLDATKTLKKYIPDTESTTRPSLAEREVAEVASELMNEYQAELQDAQSISS